MDCILDVLNTNSSRQIYKYNPYHDRQGKFARADEGVGGGSKKQRNDGGEEEKEEQVRNEIIPRMNSTQLYRQSPHIPVTNEFLERKSALERKGQYGPSYVTHGEREILRLINQYKGSGQVKINRKGIWYGSELITTYSGIVGNVVNNLNGKTVPTSVFNIHYDYDSNSGKIRKNRGVHISPYYPSKKRRRR